MSMMSDRFDFNQEQLSKVIGYLEESKACVQKCQTNYNGYVDNLAQTWTTTGGMARIEKLRNFSSAELTEFIAYFNKLIENMQATQPLVQNINEA